MEKNWTPQNLPEMSHMPLGCPPSHSALGPNHHRTSSARLHPQHHRHSTTHPVALGRGSHPLCLAPAATVAAPLDMPRLICASGLPIPIPCVSLWLYGNSGNRWGGFLSRRIFGQKFPSALRNFYLSRRCDGGSTLMPPPQQTKAFPYSPAYPVLL